MANTYEFFVCWKIVSLPNNRLAHISLSDSLKTVVKVARVVHIKLRFMDWFSYYFTVLIKQCKIPYKILNKALLFSKNQVFCLKNWKLWRAPTTLEFIFFVEILHTFPTYQCLQKSVRDFFILFRSWITCKNWKWRGFYTLTEVIFLNNSILKRNKKNTEPLFVDIGK